MYYLAQASDSPAPPGDSDVTVRTFKKDGVTSTSTANTSQEPVKVKREYEIPKGETITTTTTSGKGFQDIIPSLIPALQSSSYVLVILTAFVAWSSRKLFTDFLERHIELMGEVKVNLEAERASNEKHLAILSQLTENNRVLSSTVEKAITVRSKE